MTIRTVIVDDEPWARRRLHALLEGEPDVEVVAECADGESAVRALRTAAPDLVFLDVQMPDMSGCDVLDVVGGPLPAIVFVTAHHQYAIEAFEREAVDYLLKPFDEARFRSAVARARREVRSAKPLERSAATPLPRSATPSGERHELHTRRFLNRLAVPEHGRVVFINTRDIDVIEAAGNYVSIRSSGDTHLARVSMATLEARLDPDCFIRIHRSAIVNLSVVREMRPGSGGEPLLVLADGRELTVGRAYRRALASRLRSVAECRRRAGSPGTR